MHKFYFLFFICLSAHCDTINVAIIIDDIGYRATDEAALTLPGNITYSVLPHTPFGQKLASQAHLNNNDVMLHIPMEAVNGKFMGPGGLSSTMNETSLKQALNNALIDIPQAKGINNHMGSKLTSLSSPMQWTMEFLKEHHLFFIDSKTSQQSLAEIAAKKVGVPVLARHIFLDNELSEPYIKKQFNQFIQYALQHKHAIAIAHPHPESIAALSKLIPTLNQHNITLVPITSLFSPADIKINQSKRAE